MSKCASIALKSFRLLSVGKNNDKNELTKGRSWGIIYYMMICADFDDTMFFRENQTQTNANLVAIKGWREVGNIFVLGSNRSLGSLERTLPDWQEYFDYLILDGGTRILNRDGRLLWSNTFSQTAIGDILSIIKGSPVRPEVKFYNLSADDYESTPSESITKIYFCFQNQTDADSFESKISKVDANVLSWHHSPTDFCIEATPRTANKATAIYELMKITGGVIGDIITVGDNTNDYEMLKEFEGYAILDSKIATLYPEFRTTPSVAALVAEKIQNS